MAFVINMARLVGGELFPIECEIVAAIEKVTDKIWEEESDAIWTKAIKQALVDLGHEHQFRVYASSADKTDGKEWLWDLTWLDEGGSVLGFDFRELRGAKLACEIEWNGDKGETLYDFQKLTVSTTDYRLIVLWQRSEEKVAELIELCRGHCPASRGFRYLAVGIVESGLPVRVMCRAWTL
ncbi:MAG: hypothetical protein JRM77_09825 [Nitrososphaerota archaeon]|nr:hypothetical protein [Nitrososphaerota archaeon]